MSQGGITLPGFTLAGIALVPRGQVTHEQGEQVGQWLKQCDGAVHWWIGDWMNYGERCWPEKKCIEYACQLGFAFTTVTDDKYVAASIEVPRRRGNLPHSHHKEIAFSSLPRTDQDAGEIKLRAGRALGQVLAEMPKQAGARPADTGSLDVTPPTLDSLGIHKMHSHRCQRMAGVAADDATFGRADWHPAGAWWVRRAGETQWRLTPAGVLYASNHEPDSTDH
jgi:hypothetical protein